ncbi:hypothetical protein PLESTB_000692400 [Pleodorina starrii]|uniref:MutL C-terminal dimerisation domain-containing protein n=1 Tax=Pleodorina starrii TaxID=330485 RepID=A0A9W6BIV3_9CHLO|nr:hypothetical protein PLESTB_000692400 [Pleodorina starrii]
MRSMADLQNGVRTLGFRGEAISSLFGIADVCVTSRARGTFVTLGKNVQSSGNKVHTGPSAVQRAHSGTSVAVKRFLHNQPVRQRQLAGQHRDTEASTLQAVLRMALPFVDVSVTLLQAPTGQTLLHLPAGRNVAATFLRLVPEQPPSLPLLVANGDRGYRASAVLSSPAATYPHPHHQYMYVNRRNMRSPLLAALLNEHFLRAYQRAGYHQAAAAATARGRGLGDAGDGGSGGGRGGGAVKVYPAFLVLLECPHADYDVTSEADKSDVVFKSLPAVQGLLRDLAVQAWGLSGGQGRGGEDTAPAAAGLQDGKRSGAGHSQAPAGMGTELAAEPQLVQGLQQRSQPPAGRWALEQPMDQQRPAAMRLGAEARPVAAPRMQGPMQSLLQLQAAGGGAGLPGQSKSRSLASLLIPETEAPAPADSRRWKAARAEPGDAGGSAALIEPPSGELGGGKSGTVSERAGGGDGGRILGRGAWAEPPAASLHGDGPAEPQPRTGASAATEARKRKAAQVDLGDPDGIDALCEQSPAQAAGRRRGVLVSEAAAGGSGGGTRSRGTGGAAGGAALTHEPPKPRRIPVTALGALGPDADSLGGYGYEAGRRDAKACEDDDADANVTSFAGFLPVARPQPGKAVRADLDLDTALGAALGDITMGTSPWVAVAPMGAAAAARGHALGDTVAAALGDAFQSIGDDDDGDPLYSSSPLVAFPVGNHRWRADASGTVADWSSVEQGFAAGPAASPLLPELSPELNWQRRKPPACSGSPLLVVSPGLGYTPPDSNRQTAAGRFEARARDSYAAVHEMGDSPLFIREVRRTTVSPLLPGEADADGVASPSPVARVPMPELPMLPSPCPVVAHSPTLRSPMMGNSPASDVSADIYGWRHRDHFWVSPLWNGHEQGLDVGSPLPQPPRRFAASPAGSDFLIMADDWAARKGDGGGGGGYDLAAARATAANAFEELGRGLSCEDVQQDAWEEGLSPETIKAIARLRRQQQQQPGRARCDGGATLEEDGGGGGAEGRARSRSLAPAAEVEATDGGGLRRDCPPAAHVPMASDGLAAATGSSRARLPALPKRGDALNNFLSDLQDSPNGDAAAAGAAAAFNKKHGGEKVLANPAPGRQGTAGAVDSSRHPTGDASGSSETDAARAQQRTEAPAGVPVPAAPAAGRTGRDAAPPAAAGERSPNAAAEQRKAVRGGQRGMPIIVGVALPAGNSSRDSGDGDDAESLSPLARFLNFGNIGNDPGVTPPPCPLAAATQGAEGAIDAGSSNASAKTAAAAADTRAIKKRRPSGAEAGTPRPELPVAWTDALATPVKPRSPVRLVQSAPPHAKKQRKAVHISIRRRRAPSPNPTAATHGSRGARRVLATATSVTGAAVATPAASAAAVVGAKELARKPAQATPKRTGLAADEPRPPADADVPTDGGSKDGTSGRPLSAAGARDAAAPVCSFRWPAARAVLAPRQQQQPAPTRANPDPMPPPPPPPPRQQQQQHRNVLQAPAPQHAEGSRPAAESANGAACPAAPDSSAAGSAAGSAANGATAATASEDSSGQAAAASGSRTEQERSESVLSDSAAAPGGRTPGGILRKRPLSGTGRTPKRVRFHVSLEESPGARPAGESRHELDSSPSQQQQQHEQRAIDRRGPELGQPAATGKDTGQEQQQQQQRGLLLPEKQPGPAPGAAFGGVDGVAPGSGVAAADKQQPAVAAARLQQPLQGLRTPSLQQGQQALGGISQDARRVLSLELDLLRLAASGQQLVPSHVSRSALAGPAARVLRQVDRKFIPVMGAGGTLLIIDQHAAHERVRLEQLTEQLRACAAAGATRAGRAAGASGSGLGGADSPGGGPSEPRLVGDTAAAELLCVQPLAPPVALQLATHEAAALARHAGVVAAWGWRLRAAAGGGRGTAAGSGAGASGAGGGGLERSTLRFAMLMLQQQQQPKQLVMDAGGAQVLVGVPSVCGTPLTNPTDLRAYLQQLHETSGADLLPPAVLRVLRSKACRTAVMFGDALQRDMCAALLTQLRAARLWTQCAHGRPTVAPLVHLPTLRAVLERRRTAARLGEGADPWVDGGDGAGRRRLSAAALRAAIQRSAAAGRVLAGKEGRGDGGGGDEGVKE